MVGNVSIKGEEVGGRHKALLEAEDRQRKTWDRSAGHYN